MIGVVGFLLMLMTETLYSFRKRSRKGRWGSMQSWLQFHIFTGLVGPYMVLLHTSWKFNGLAGATTLLTIIIVISGFIGRYIYTRIPRSLDGYRDYRSRRTSPGCRARPLPAVVVHLARDPHPDWDSAVRSCFYSYWGCAHLRHVAPLEMR